MQCSIAWYSAAKSVKSDVEKLSAIQSSVVSCCAVECWTVKYSAILYKIMQDRIMYDSIVQYSRVQCSAYLERSLSPSLTCPRATLV